MVEMHHKMAFRVKITTNPYLWGTKCFDMADIKDHLKDISEIRGLMERNSKFLSLSGLSGVSSGLFALVGASVAYWRAGQDLGQPQYLHYDRKLMVFLVVDALLVLTGALTFSVYFSRRMAKKQGLPFFNKIGRHLLFNMTVPLVAGGGLTLIQLAQGHGEYLVSTMLIFYGLALLSGSKYTHAEIRWLGLIQIALGLASAAWQPAGFALWTLGFGMLHIVYGAVMYFKYER